MTSLPLSALRERLDAGSLHSYWTVKEDGVPGRALVQVGRSVVSFPLSLSAPVCLRGQVRLFPHDWRDALGAVTVRIEVTDAGGVAHELWGGTLSTVSRRLEAAEPADGLRFRCALPADSIALKLLLESEPIEGHVGRVLWLDTELLPEGATGDAAGEQDTDPGAQESGDRNRPRSGDLTPHSSESDGRPLISVLTPVHDPPLELLEQTIESVLRQDFTDWELCLVDDGSGDPEVIAALDRHAEADPRIRLTRHEVAGGISAATNAALELATGEYVALLDHDDTLAPEALEVVADRLTREPSLDLLYSDEAVISDEGHTIAVTKPDFSPEHLHALMYTCHLGVYRRRLALDVGGFRSSFDGCQDYDFVLRLIERTDHVGHVPAMLYHWRAHAQSTAGGDAAKPYAYAAQPSAISGHLDRTGTRAEVAFGPHPGMHRIVYPVDERITVTIVVAAADTAAAALAAAALTWRSQPHAAWEVVLAGLPEAIEACRGELARAGVEEARISDVQTVGNHHASALAAGVTAARTELVLAMQAPMLGLTHDWLRRLAGYSMQPGIACSAPVVLAPDSRIAEAGIAVPNGMPLPLIHGADAAHATPVATNLSAVSGAVMVGRRALARLGGLRPEYGDLVLVELGLRARDAGLRNVLVPDVRLGLASADYVDNEPQLLWRMQRERGGEVDPFYNPAFRDDRGDFTQRTPA